ncbi:unnamed protein product, partial [Polarella glacialis]
GSSLLQKQPGRQGLLGNARPCKSTMAHQFPWNELPACPLPPSTDVEISQAWVATWISPAATLCIGGARKAGVPTCHCDTPIPDGSYGLQYSAHAQGNVTLSRCVIGVCPFGQHLAKVTLPSQMWSLPFAKNVSTNLVCLDSNCTGCSKEDCVRGICMDNATASLSPGALDLLPMPKTVLYWGGLVGDASRGPADQTGFHAARFVKNVLDFSQEKHISVPTMVINNWVTDVGHGSFAFLSDPRWLVDNWLNEASKRGLNTTGVVAYINPKDASYSIAVNVSSGPLMGYYDFRWTVPANGSCPTEVHNSTTGQAEPLDYNACIASNTCPPGCPNYHSQIMAYLGLVNNISIASGLGALITDFIFDGEDGGSYSSDYGFCLLKKAAETWAPSITSIGYAKALNSGKLGIYDNFVQPETYWYMNELGNDPVRFLYWLRASSHCAGGQNYLASLAQNAGNSPPGAIQAMMSLENLGQTAPAAKCLASEFFGKDLAGAKGGVCGFAYWAWADFAKFLKVFAAQYNLTTVGIYEAQFLPPAWFESSEYPYPFTSLECLTDQDCTAMGGVGVCRDDPGHEGACQCRSGDSIPVLCTPPTCTRPLMTCPKGPAPPTPGISSPCTSDAECQVLGDHGAYCKTYSGGDCHCGEGYVQVNYTKSTPPHVTCGPSQDDR